MKLLLLRLILFVCFQAGFSQVTNAVEKYELDDAIVNESSGLIYYNNKIITHNDSGNPELYEMDPTANNITRTVTITGAANLDWEDITQDDNYIYIGDIGNNNGNRINLKIYKISKADYDASNSVAAETINFNYTNQSDFTSNPQGTPWDAETLISIDANNLLLISKNWDTFVTQAYLIPKIPGNYELNPLTTTLFDAGHPNDLITGGTYNPLTNKVFLIGYTWNTSTFDVLQPFIYDCSGFISTDVFSGTNTRYDIAGTFGLEQTEGITYFDENTYYVTSELFNQFGFTDTGKLIEVTTSDVALSISNMNKTTISLYPNPTTNEVYITNAKNTLVEVYDMQAKRLLQTQTDTVNMRGFSPGMYVFKITSIDKQVTVKKVLKH